jgi:hypothetical protein
MPAGHELVTEAGRVFVILPTAPTPPQPRSHVGWLVGGIVGALALIVIVGVGVISSLAAGNKPSTGTAAAAQPQLGSTGPVNVRLATIKANQCAFANTFSTDPTLEVDATVTTCDETNWQIHTALWVKEGISRDDVAGIAESEAADCHGPSGVGDSRLVWSSTDGHTGILICFN